MRQILNSILAGWFLGGLALNTGWTIDERSAHEMVDEELVGAKHGYADSDGVRIHYVSMGKGPLVVMVHGFPDYWYSWRRQMPALAKKFRVVAIDQRGYNLSDKPEGVENYRMEKLVNDVKAVIDHFQEKKAVIVGHDWGGMVGWSFSMAYPKRTQRLVILNLPHPKGLRRELETNPQQQKNSQYARDFQKPDAVKHLTAEGLAGWVKDRDARKKYVAAFKRSSFEGMLNYYKANYPGSTREKDSSDQKQEGTFPKVQCPVLIFHGLKDRALLPSGLNGTWNWVNEELTIVTVPGAGHFVQQDAADLVTRKMTNWLSEGP